MDTYRHKLTEKAARGGFAGLAATGAMSLLLVAADAAGVMDYEPPRKIVDKFFPWVPEPLRNAAAIVAHFGYGMVGGCLFSLALKKRPTAGAGLGYGAVVWAAGYEGWLPAMGVLPPAHRDKTGRAWTMLAAHFLYGAVLGKAFETLTPAIPGPGGPGGVGAPLEEAGDMRPPPRRLPYSYRQYLEDKDPAFVAAVLPVLEQSAATQERGVHVRHLPGGAQALIDQAVPYPEVTEGDD